MFVLGLTGGIACGKTTATNFFFKKGIEIVDADEISRKLQKNGQPAFDGIYSKYGPSILGPDQEIDRKILRDKAFSNLVEKKWLEDLMHPLIREAIIQAFSNIKSKWAVYSAPLWSERNQFERVLVIDSPKSLQLERIKNRDKSNTTIAESILDAQMSSHDRINYATDLIINDSSIDVLNNKLEFYYNLYTRLANDKKS